MMIVTSLLCKSEENHVEILARICSTIRTNLTFYPLNHHLGVFVRGVLARGAFGPGGSPDTV